MTDAIQFMKYLQNAGIYSVDKTSLGELNFVFDQIGIDMLDPITQDTLQEIYKNYKRIIIACPVSVVVTDPSGRQIARLNADGTKMVNNMYSAYFSIEQIADNDFMKILNIPDGEEGKNYKVELEGTDEGTMRISTQKFNEVGPVSSPQNEENIPVHLGSKWYIDFSASVYGELKAGNSVDNNASTSTPSSRSTHSENLSNTYTRYDVVLSQANGGEIKANSKRITAGSLVKLTAKPDFGYQVDTLTVTAENGTTIETRYLKDGTYAFTMPRMNVSVTTTFKQK